MDTTPYRFEGTKLQPGDIVCTRDGTQGSVGGRMWDLIGSLLPGEADHIALYVGPGPRFLEAGPHGVRYFEMPDGHWDSTLQHGERGFLDRFIGVVSPYPVLADADAAEHSLRARILDYCKHQLGKPYNFNFLDPHTEAAFYCSQLVYKAFLTIGLDLHTGAGVPRLPLTLRMAVLPQEIWQGAPGERQRVQPMAMDVPM